MPTTPKVLSIFSGGCGCNNALKVLNQVSPKTYPGLDAMVMNTDLALTESQFSRRNRRLAAWFQKGQLGVVRLGSGYGAGCDPNVAKEALGPHLEDIKQKAKNADIVILHGGLGKGTGTGTITELGKLFGEWEVPHLAVVTNPFDAEGPDFLIRAQAARGNLFQTTPTIPIYNQNLLEILGANDVDVDLGWQEINDGCLVPMLLVLLEIILRVGNVTNIDLNDILALLRYGKYLFFGLCRIDREFTLETGRGRATEIVAKLTSNPYQDPQVIGGAKKGLMWTHGSGIGLLANQDIMTGVKSKMSQKPGEGIGIPHGVRTTANAGKEDLLGKRWIALLTAAKEPPGSVAALSFVAGLISRGAEEASQEETSQRKVVSINQPTPMTLSDSAGSETTASKTFAPRSPAILRVIRGNGSEEDVAVRSHTLRDWNILNRSTAPNLEQIERILKTIDRETDGGRPADISPAIRKILAPPTRPPSALARVATSIGFSSPSGTDRRSDKLSRK